MQSNYIAKKLIKFEFLSMFSAVSCRAHMQRQCRISHQTGLPAGHSGKGPDHLTDLFLLPRKNEA
jgi:hypothetical protein